MYKNDSNRRKEITKLETDHETGGGFRPAEFKSSRSKPMKANFEKLGSEQLHENAIFGSTTESAVAKPGAIVMPVNKPSDSAKETGKPIANASERALMNENVMFKM